MACSRGQEGIEPLRQAEAAGRSVAVAAVVFDWLATMEARFGSAVASEAMAAVERERLAALTTGRRLHDWAPAMGVWLIEACGGTEAHGERLEEALAGPFARYDAGGRSS